MAKYYLYGLVSDLMSVFSGRPKEVLVGIFSSEQAAQDYVMSCIVDGRTEKQRADGLRLFSYKKGSMLHGAHDALIRIVPEDPPVFVDTEST